MQYQVKSIRPFIGAKDFEIARRFYNDFGFKEVSLGPEMSYFGIEGFGFYLQKAYVKDWIDNTMVFLEVDDVRQFWEGLLKLELPSKYESVRVEPVRDYDWGSECFVHDPSGVLWHIGEFRK
jgi:catechol 2,3-dioxygenase-like lactoylglutathione lyase family enzyme